MRTFARHLALPLVALLLLSAGTDDALARGKKGSKKPGANKILEPPSSVKRYLTAIANHQLGMAVYCAKAKLNEEGRAHLAIAKTYDPANPNIAPIAAKLGDGPSEASDIRKKSYERKKKSSDKAMEKMKYQLVAAETKAAQSGPLLRKASTHMMEYLISLPSGWRKGQKYDVLVTVEGAGCGWLGNHRSFAKHKGKELIIVTPITFWNTNALNVNKYNYPEEVVQKHDKDSAARMKFDEEGLLAALKDVQEQFGGKDKFFITGFSGGGNLTWRMVFGHPDKVRGAAPACGNFGNPGKINTTAPERAEVIIHAFQGEKDQYLDGKGNKPVNLNNEYAHAERLCKQHGFTNIKRTMLPGVGHSNCNKQVADFVKGVIAGGK